MSKRRDFTGLSLDKAKTSREDWEQVVKHSVDEMEELLYETNENIKITSLYSQKDIKALIS